MSVSCVRHLIGSTNSVRSALDPSLDVWLVSHPLDKAGDLATGLDGRLVGQLHEKVVGHDVGPAEAAAHKPLPTSLHQTALNVLDQGWHCLLVEVFLQLSLLSLVLELKNNV